MTEIPVGTMARMRITRRFSHYNVGDLIVVPMGQGLELEAKRLAQPLDLLVPSMRTPTLEGAEAPTAVPARQPAQMVRK